MEEAISGFYSVPSIKEELAGSRIQDAPDGWLKELFKRRQISRKAAGAYLKQSPFYRNGRWDVVEERFIEVDDMGRNVYAELYDYTDRNDRLNHRFMDIFNDIIAHCIGDKFRKTLVTQSTVCDNPRYVDGERVYPKTGPDLIIHFVQPGAYAQKMSGNRMNPYPTCVALGNVERVQRSRHDDPPVERLAKYARERLEQRHRLRFIFGFHISPTTFQLFYFDRLGVVKSAEIDIHQDAATLVQAVQFLADNYNDFPDDETIVRGPNSKMSVKTVSGGKTIVYDFDHTVFRHPAMFGSGTKCWAVCKAVKKKKQVLMKSKWHGEEWGREADMLFIARRARVPGVEQLIAFDQTHPANKPISTASLRRSLGIPNRPGGRNLVFSRTIVELHGKSISHFESGLQLLQAFRDAINGHYHLVKASILHRDISAENILLTLKLNSRNGKYGVLANLGRATLCDRGRCPPESDAIAGTFMFRSVNNLTGALRKILKGRHRHNFVDDLESFFWVYVWITTVHNGPGKEGVEEDKVEDAAFMQGSTSTALSRHWKQLYLTKFDERGFKDITRPFFSEPVYLTILDELREMMAGFNSRRRATDAKGVHIEVDFFPEMEEIYTQVLGYFDSAIAILSSPSYVVQTDQKLKRAREDSSDPSESASPEPEAKKQRVDEESVDSDIEME